jgi:hypothetical protein
MLRQAGVEDEHRITPQDGQELVEIETERMDRVHGPLDGDEQRSVLG